MWFRTRDIPVSNRLRSRCRFIDRVVQTIRVARITRVNYRANYRATRNSPFSSFPSENAFVLTGRLPVFFRFADEREPA